MTQRDGSEAPSPSVSSIRLSLGRHSRRGSLASTSSRPAVDKESMNLALDQIHNTASRSATLITFDEFASPPPSALGNDSRGITADLVPGGLSGLYSRLKATVGSVKEAAAGSPTSLANDSSEDVSVSSVRGKGSLKATKSGAGTIVSSPVVVSASSSKLNSPLASNFPDPQLSSIRHQDSFSSTKQPSSLPRSPLILASKSKPSVAASGPEILNLDSIKEEEKHPPHGNSTSKSTFPPSSQSSSVASSRVISDTRSIGSQARTSRETGDIVDQDDSDSTVDEVVLVSTNPDSADIPGPALDALVAEDSQAREALRRMSGNNATVSSRKEQGIQSAPSITSETGLSERSVTPAPSGPPQRPPLLHISQSHLPGFRPSRASSSDGGLSSIMTTIAPSRPSQTPANDEPPQVPTSVEGNTAFSQMRRKILSKDFWMRDENAKDCFYCGNSFSTFRRKHHCRTCGQIFDAKCTSLIPGKLFGQSGSLRVCKPCENIINGNDDDSSVYTEDADRSIMEPEDNSFQASETDGNDPDSQAKRTGSALIDQDYTKIGTPMISIPMSRKLGSDKKRRSAVIELDTAPVLARPSSSRSLRSLSGRPRSSSHKRHLSRHQHMRNVKYDDGAPFHRHDLDNLEKRFKLPAFHHDNIIDPDLAPFMSDEGSSEDEQMSIFAALSGNQAPPPSAEGDKSAFGGFLAGNRKSRSRAGTRSVGFGEGSAHSRDFDLTSVSNRHAFKHSRKRGMSISSGIHGKSSPKRNKSNNLLKTFGVGLSSIGLQPQAQANQNYQIVNSSSLKVTRSAAMRGADAPAVELNAASLQHVRRLLRQMLQDAGVSNHSSWERALMPILLQCTDDVNPDVQHHDDIDIRHYIKLKKIPGGRPGDTVYVSGVVFTKNLALKSMPRSIANPRIILVTFAIEYARHQQHFMSLEPVIAQEKEYLRNLVSRIAALGPHLLLVQRNVAGLALQFLEEAGIAVAYNVKPSVLNAVSRCTKARMISSVDKLAADPSHLGTCESFEVRTHVYGKAKKTYMYLSGCQKDLGCTIVLRGAEPGTLKRLKRITEFMCYVVYNLKLETCLMRDEFVLIPATTDGGTLSQDKTTTTKPIEKPEPKDGTNVPEKDGATSTTVPPESQNTDTPTEKQDAEAPVSQTPVPASQNDNDNEKATKDEEVPEDIPHPIFYSEMVEKHQTKILSASPFVKFMQPYLLMQAREQERRLAYLKRLRDQYKPDDTDGNETSQKFELVHPEMVHTVPEKASRPVREFLHAVHSAEYDKALHNYQTQSRQWEAYLSGNMDLFDPFNHQKIAVLYTVVNSTTSTPCVGPDIIALGFYHEHDIEDGFAADCTLGQYVEDLCQSGNTICESPGCDRKMFDHHRQYVHGEGQMSVIVQKFPSKIRGLQNTILMWSCCRICGQETQVIPMSDNTWKYSFAKYLELTFWCSELHPRAGVCPHDIHRDHVRYFGFNNVALRIQYDKVSLYEVIVPRPTITWKVDSDLRLKNEQYKKIEDRLDRFMSSVRARLKSIQIDSIVPEKAEACRAEVERLLKKANEDHEWLKRKLQDKYMMSRYYEIIPLNRAIRAIQEKAIAWDDTFVDFEKQYFPSEKDIRRLAALQLKKIFLERDESVSSLTSVEENGEEAGEGAMTEKVISRDLSPEHTRDVLTSVVEQDQSHASSTEPGHEESQQKPVEPETVDDQKPDDLSTSPEQTVNREGVRHLDLAVPATLTPEKSMELGKDNTQDETPSRAASPKDEEARTLMPPPPLPLDRTVSDAVDLMREGALSPTPSTDGNYESKIPRPVDSNKRETPPRPSALIRAQSQPGTIPRLLPGASTASTLTLSSTSSRDLIKPSLTEAARALEKRMTERLGLGTFKHSKASMIPRSVPRKRMDARVSTLANFFEREFERQRQRAERSKQARAYPLASARPIVEVYRDVHDAVQEREPDDDLPTTTLLTRANTVSVLEESSNADTTPAPTVTAPSSPVDERASPELPDRNAESEDHTANTSLQHSDIEAEGSDTEHGTLEDIEMPENMGMEDSQILSPNESDLSLELPKHEKTSLMKMLTSFWSERSSSGWAPLDYPFAQNEHVWEDSDIIVREDEPSSIIALALSSPDYVAKLQTFRTQGSEVEKDGSGIDAPSGDFDEASIERNLLHQANTNIRYGFTNRGVRAQCKIFYAQSFDALRRKCGVADRFVESLSRCLKYDSKGGKSKSIFLKTLDDRFVLKSLSPVEVNSFFRFAPNYFAFTHQNLFKGLPSVIAKMFGLFQVQIKTPNGRDFDWFILVMENLFYDREPNRRFDLKGSMRNRKIQSTGERDEVLLDENLVDIIYSETPIFVREHTKKLLKASVWNDTLFLSKQNVMDYSLMAGFDDTRREIIVGIIDCIRTYTWDKKLETWIKDRGKNKPTITSPKDYRNRFRIAMEKYILQAPNCWYQFQAQPLQRREVRLVDGPPSGLFGGKSKQEEHKDDEQVLMSSFVGE